MLASHDRVLLDDVCTDLFDLDPSDLGTDGRGGRRFGGGWTAYEEHRAAARRRWEETYAEQQEELTRLRAATRIGTSAIAHNRPPRDNDKHIYGFKGAQRRPHPGPAQEGRRAAARRSPSASRCASRARRCDCGPT